MLIDQHTSPNKKTMVSQQKSLLTRDIQKMQKKLKCTMVSKIFFFCLINIFYNIFGIYNGIIKILENTIASDQDLNEIKYFKFVIFSWPVKW